MAFKISDEYLPAVTIYRPDSHPEKRTDIDSVSGEGPVATFTLDLRRVWNPISAASR
jgi:hypothetical protein